jgi:predicted membrane protein
VTAEVGVGELVVLVPEDARVVLDADVQLGELRIDGVPRTNDASPEFAGTLPGGSDLGPVIDLTVSTTLGSLEVSRA